MTEPNSLLDFSLVAALFHVVIAPITALHALMFKRDSRAALGWIALCVLLPVAGPILYTVLGINRIRRRARRLEFPGLRVGFERGRALRTDREHVAEPGERHAPMSEIGDRLTPHEMFDGNSVEALVNGETAYPSMLEAIESADRSVYLATYIFDTDGIGSDFIDALTRAGRRGVDVRVVIDGIGQYYSWPLAVRRLRRAGVQTELFLPPRLLPPRLSINLRLHRKGLIVDGCTAFVGGLNIGDRHLVETAGDRNAVADVHFRLAGPVASQLEGEFLRTWEFITDRRDPPPPLSVLPAGDVCCRTVTDGPDEDLDQITMLLNATIAQARETVRIMTPYFLPPRELIAALQAARLRGVDVTLVLPGHNNLPFVHWATRNILGELLYQGVSVYYQPAPFVHSKLFVVDDCYTLIGSSNWDARSLRLNFELQVEVFGEDVARRMSDHVDKAVHRGRPVTLDEVDRRGFFVRARDSLCWLFSPYL